MRHSLMHLAALAAVLPAGLAAQSPNDLRKAADGITSKLVYERLSVIAHDSMGGRNTPSPGLEKTAAYIVSLYQKAGLKPAGENGTWYQRYPLVRKRVNQATAYLELNENGTVSRYPMGEFAYATGNATGKEIVGEAMLLAGTLTVADVQPLDLTGKVVLMVFDATKAIDWNRVAQAVAAKRPATMIMIRNDAPEAFARARDRAGAVALAVDKATPPTRPLTIHAHDQLFANDPMNANRPDLASMRLSATPVIMPIPETVALSAFAAEEIVERVMVPNVVAKIEGSDPVLKNEYVVYSAHMDHVGTIAEADGCSHRGDDDRTDMVCNGADDNGSGVSGLLEVTRALAAAKPRRSIIVCAFAAEENGMLGSAAIARRLPVEKSKIVAMVNMDMIGRGEAREVAVLGTERNKHLERLVQRADGLGKTGIRDLVMGRGQELWQRSDQYEFHKIGIPSLFFFEGLPITRNPDYHTWRDTIDKLDLAKIENTTRLVFNTVWLLATEDERPPPSRE